MILFSPTLKAGKSARLCKSVYGLGIAVQPIRPRRFRTLNNRFVTLLTPVDFVDPRCIIGQGFYTLGGI